jgi:hypothetical protein
LQSVGFTHFFILRVGYWGSYSIINEIKAQEDFCAENENCYIITRAPSLIPYPGATTSNWWKYEPSYEYNDCRDSYITNTTNKHFNEKAFKIFARKSADNIHRILHLGLEPLLEEENVKDMLPGEEEDPESDLTSQYYYGGVELYTVVEGAYLGNVVPTKFTESSTAYSQIFAVEPNTTYKATAVYPDKQIVYVLLESDTGLTIGGSLDFVSSNTTGARTVGEKNEPQVITTTADCYFIAFSGFKGTDGKYQHVKLEKVE